MFIVTLGVALWEWNSKKTLVEKVDDDVETATGKTTGKVVSFKDASGRKFVPVNQLYVEVPSKASILSTTNVSNIANQPVRQPLQRPVAGPAPAAANVGYVKK
jgi:hypothetical protein